MKFQNRSTLSVGSLLVQMGLRARCGALCSQCSYPKCYKGFHVLCGRQEGGLLTFTEDGTALGFCLEHSKESFAVGRMKVLGYK